MRLKLSTEEWENTGQILSVLQEHKDSEYENVVGSMWPLGYVEIDMNYAVTVFQRYHDHNVEYWIIHVNFDIT